MQHRKICLTLTALALAIGAGVASASSHREAPFVTEHPKIDGTDFYMFRSYEPGRDGFVTILADYQPLQAPGGGPNYFTLDPNALYEIMIDNNGDGVEDLTFQFRFTDTVNNASLSIGGTQIPVPLTNIGTFGPGVTDGDANKNVIENYTLTVVRGGRRSGTATPATNASDGTTNFRKPVDNIGNKSVADYATYSNNHIFPVNIPGCSAGKVFVGQRKDPFFVNLGEVFDLANLNPVGDPNGKPDALAGFNVDTFALEVPIDCLVVAGGSPIIGGWTTASLRQAEVFNPHPKGALAGTATDLPASITGGAWNQVSRLGAPLVNELIIGLPDKDRFNASQPKDDAQFLKYVTNPTLPALLQALFPSVTAPTAIPRNDLVAAFLTGVQGLNQPTGVTPAEELRLNTSMDAKPAAQQSNLGVLGGDTSGFPNGRRPGDDVVDIELRVAMGVLLPAAQAPSGQLPFTDQTTKVATDYPSVFPYVNTALPGSPDAAPATPAASASKKGVER